MLEQGRGSGVLEHRRCIRDGATVMFSSWGAPRS